MLKLLTVLLLVASLEHPTEAANHRGATNRTAAQSEPKPQARAKPSNLAAIEDQIQRVASALETANRKQQTPEEKTDAKRDLAAQEMMASNARSMTYIGAFEAFITFVGVLLVGWTLYHTKRAADAAHTALSAQDRPHMVVLEIGLAQIEEGVEAEKNLVKYAYRLENKGEDLAFLTKFWFSFGWAIVGMTAPQPRVDTVDLFWPLAPAHWWGTELPNSTHTIEIPAAVRAAVKSGAFKLYAFGCISYLDTAQKPHEHAFVYELRTSDWKFVPHRDARFWKHT